MHTADSDLTDLDKYLRQQKFTDGRTEQPADRHLPREKVREKREERDREKEGGRDGRRERERGGGEGERDKYTSMR